MAPPKRIDLEQSIRTCKYKDATENSGDIGLSNEKEAGTSRRTTSYTID